MARAWLNYGAIGEGKLTPWPSARKLVSRKTIY